LSPVWLTLKLTTVTTGLLLVFSTQQAWWLAQSKSKWAATVEAVVALPLVLPPTVLGFYLLLAFIRKLHDELAILVIYVSHSLQEVLQITALWC